MHLRRDGRGEIQRSSGFHHHFSRDGLHIVYSCTLNALAMRREGKKSPLIWMDCTVTSAEMVCILCIPACSMHLRRDGSNKKTAHLDGLHRHFSRDGLCIVYSCMFNGLANRCERKNPPLIWIDVTITSAEMVCRRCRAIQK